MLALRGAGLFDGESDGVVDQPLVLVDGGRITAIEAGRVEPPDGADVVDLGD